MNFQIKKLTGGASLESTLKSLAASNKALTLKLVKDATGSGPNFTFVPTSVVVAASGSSSSASGTDAFNIIFGTGADDILSGGAGLDIIIGDKGNDTASYAYLNGGTDGVDVDLARRAATVNDGDVDILSGIENVIGSDNSDILKGNSVANVFTPGGGNDIIDGRGGDDTIILAGRAEDWNIVANPAGYDSSETWITFRNGTDTVTFRNIETLRFTLPSEDGEIKEFSVGGKTSGGGETGIVSVIARDDGNDGDGTTQSDNSNIAINVSEGGESAAVDLIENDTVISNTATAEVLVTAISADESFGSEAEAQTTALSSGAAQTATNGFGTLTLNENGTVTFVANGDSSNALALGQTAVTTFYYQVAGGDTAQISFTVTGTNDGPTIDAASTTLGDVKEDIDNDPAVSGIQLTDSGTITFDDIDLTDTHTVMVTGVGTTLGMISHTMTQATGLGSGSVMWKYTLDNSLVQGLAEGATATETFKFVIDDGKGQANSKVETTVAITIVGTNDIPLIFAPDVINVNEDASVSGSVAATDADTGQTATLTYALAEPDVAPEGLSFSSSGHYTFNASSYDHLGAGVTQTLTVKFTATDTAGATSAPGTLTITITGTNDTAVVTSAAVVTSETDAPLNLSGNLTVTDLDDGEASFVTQTNVTGTLGKFSIDGQGSWTFVANSAFDELVAGDTRTETFAVQTLDGTSSSVKITITGTNDVPVVTAAANNVDEDVTITGSVSGTDADTGQTGTLSYALTGEAPTGLTFNPDGTYTFNASSYDSLPAGQQLVLTIAFTATDTANATSAPANLVITITGTNDVPVATAAMNSVFEDATITGSVSGMDADTGQTATLNYALTGEAPTGLTFNSDGSYTFNASSYDSLPAGQQLVLTIAFTATDTAGSTSAPANLVITITGTNDAPTMTAECLVANGSFESPDVGGSFDTLQNPALTGWTIATAPGTNPANAVELVNDGESGLYTPYGDQWLDMRNSPGGVSVSQAIAGAKEGTEYTLSFSLANRSSGPQSVEVFWGGVSQGVFTIESQSPLGPNADSFVTRMITVTGGADAAGNMLTFRASAFDGVGGNQGLALDNICLVASANQTMTEDTQLSGAEAMGSFAVADVDTGDTLTAAINTTIGISGDMGVLTTAQINALKAGLTLGSMTLANPGTVSWAYELVNTAAQALNNGQSVTLAYTIDVRDVAGATVSKPVSITITGTNDAPVISVTPVIVGNPSDAFAAANEAGTAPAAQIVGNLYEDCGLNGNLQNNSSQNGPDNLITQSGVTDVDNTTASLTIDAIVSGTGTLGANGSAIGANTVVQGTYGYLTIQPNGSYVYELYDGNDTNGAAAPADNAALYAPLNALSQGQIATETFSFAINDPQGGISNTGELKFTVVGTNDRAIITGSASATVIEDVPLNAPALSVVTGDLNSTDVDGTNDLWQTTFTASPNAASYGTFGIATDGTWTFSLNNSSPAVQSMAEGMSKTLNFFVKTADGTPKTVTITIRGQEDVPVIVGAGTNLVNNGSFELPEVAGSGGQFGTVVPTGWTNDIPGGSPSNGMTRTEVHEEPGRATTPYGDQWLDTALSPGNTSVSQVVAGVTSGATYVLSVSLSRGGGSHNGGATDDGVTIKWGGVTLRTFQVNDLPANGSFMTYSFAVTGGTGAANTIQIVGLGNNTSTSGGGNVGIAVDNVCFVSATGTTGTVTEDAPATPSTTDSLTATGTFSVSDVDRGDDLEITEQLLSITGTAPDGSALSAPANAALVQTLRAAFTTTPEVTSLPDISSTDPGSASGTVTWTYNLPNSDVQYLAANQTITLTYVITVTDNVGGTAQQPVTITIVGTNDVPTIGGDMSGTVTEDGLSDFNAATTDTVTATGTLTISDVDTGQSTFQSASGNTTHGTYTVSTTGMWSYTVGTSSGVVQALAVGQSTTDTFTVLAADGTPTNVTVTINGTNDGVTVVSSGTSASAAYTELAETSTNSTVVNLGGTIAFTDVDLTDVHTPSLTGTPSYTWTLANGTTAVTPPTGFVVPGTFGFGSVSESASTAGGTVGWTYAATDGAFDFLGAGQILTIAQTVTIADGNGSSTTQVVTVKITGTNDGPMVEDVTGQIDEDQLLALMTPDNSDLNPFHEPTLINLIEELAITDLDTGDTHTLVDTDADTLGDQLLKGTVTLNLAAEDVAEDADSDLEEDTTTSFTFDISDLLELGAISVDANGDLTIAEGFADILGIVMDNGDSLVIDAELTIADSQGAKATADLDFTIIGKTDTI